MEFAGDGSDVAPTRIVAVESADGGATWGRHRVLATTAPGELNVYSPNLIRAQDGGILLCFMRQQSAAPVLTSQVVWRSDDEGARWTPVCEHSAGRDYSLCNAVVKRLSSGRLLLPVCTVTSSGTGPYGHTYAVVVLYSDDDGLNWRVSEGRGELPMRGAMEPHVEACADGRVLMVMRTQLGSVFAAESTDDGVTWSKPQTTALRAPESCPEITRIPGSDDLLMIWNNAPYDPSASHYGKRSPLTAAVSRDGGRTWGPPRDIESDPTRAFSNPGCRFLPDGRAVVNYWTCVYTESWAMCDIIDLRVAVIERDWFYGRD
jgi:sialidase-1